MAELAGAIIDLVLSVLTARAMSWRPFDGVRARRRTTEFARGQQVAVPFRWEDVPLLLGLGGVALLVGGIGVANTMVISVLERRSEIGLRRALGATRRQIHAQFVTESLILSALGGLGGVTLGALVTIGYAVHQGWPWDLPPWAALSGVGLTVLIGVIAGLNPASRASRTSPTAALSAS